MKRILKNIWSLLIYFIFLLISINTVMGKDIWDKLQKWRKE